MVPLPKRKHSKGRRDRRRAHDGLQAVNLVQCSQCGEMRLPHTADFADANLAADRQGELKRVEKGTGPR